LNGFAESIIHKNNLRVLFGEKATRSSGTECEIDSCGMRSDAIVKQRKNKNKSRESAFVEKKSELIKSDDTEMQHVPHCRKDSITGWTSNDRPKLSRFPTTSRLLSSLGQTSSQAVVSKRKAFTDEQVDETQYKKRTSTNRLENFDPIEPLRFEIRDNLIDEKIIIDLCARIWSKLDMVLTIT
jgi:hypothetical protein